MSSQVDVLQTEQPVGTTPVSRRPFLWIVLIALALRVGYMLLAQTYLPSHVNGGRGPGEASNIGRSIAEGNGFSSPFSPYGGYTGPTAWIAPVYPYLCAAVFKLLGVYTSGAIFLLLFINSVASALTCIPVVLIADRTVGRRVGIWAAWAWAVIPLFMRWPATWLWEIGFSALLMALLFLFTVELAHPSSLRRWAGFGALWGFSALTNPALLSFLPFSLAWPAWKLRREGKNSLRPVLLGVLACAVVVAPWLIRNLVVFRTPVFIRDNFGFEMRLGNFHGSTGMGWSGLHPMVNPRQFAHYRRMGEVAFVTASRDEVVQFIRQYPGEFILLCLRRFEAFWDGDSLRFQGKESWQAWMIWPLSLLALFGMLFALERHRNGAWLFALALFFYPTAYYLAYPHVRYRHAIEPLMLILAVYFFFEVARRLRRSEV